MMRTCLCIHSFSLIKDIMERISSLSSVDVVGITTVLPKDTAIFREKVVDVLILDCTYEQTEAILLARTIKQDHRLQTKIIYLFSSLSEEIVQSLIQDNIHYYQVHPFGADSIVRMISDEVGAQISSLNMKRSKASLIVQVMQSLGLPVHLQGYTFIKSAATIVHDSPKSLHISMKYIYKSVARMHGTTISRVEKSMRTTIEFAFRVAPQRISVEGKKPTNSQVVHYISEQVYVLEDNQKSEVNG